MNYLLGWHRKNDTRTREPEMDICFTVTLKNSSPFDVKAFSCVLQTAVGWKRSSHLHVPHSSLPPLKKKYIYIYNCCGTFYIEDSPLLVGEFLKNAIYLFILVIFVVLSV